MGRSYKAGIIGCGNIGSGDVFSHAAAYRDNPATVISLAADSDRKRLVAFRKKWKPKSARPLDIVSICTPVRTHYNVLMGVSRSPVRAIWCEKPISDDLRKARRMVETCRRRNIVLAVNYYRRWSRPHRMVKKFIDKKKLGDAQRVICCYSKGLLNNASHLIDLMRFYFGEVAWVKAGPDTVLWFKGGFPASLHSFDDRHFRIIEMDIIGTKGRIRIKDAERVFEYYKTGSHPWVPGLKALKPHKVFKYGRDLLQPMRAALNDIIDCMERNKRPFCSGEDGLRALAVVEAIKESYRKNGAKINVRYA